MMDDFRVFITLVECGNFTKAALKLNVKQSTVTRKIQNLEEEIGFPLIIRSTRHIEITPEGQVLYSKVSNTLNQVSELIKELKFKNSDELSGDLVISLPYVIGNNFINPFLGDYLRSNPKVSLQIIYRNTFVDLIKDYYDL